LNDLAITNTDLNQRSEGRLPEHEMELNDNITTSPTSTYREYSLSSKLLCLIYMLIPVWKCSSDSVERRNMARENHIGLARQCWHLNMEQLLLNLC